MHGQTLSRMLDGTPAADRFRIAGSWTCVEEPLPPRREICAQALDGLRGISLLLVAVLLMGAAYVL